ncbi:MAG: radical SAM family heme chaperone HemW [Prevotellaceae bacterium]|jgi:oxygen-independent coproporphyrinogen-3 oxidase|nr:radical SAM family heme chaperone HemW [Prevotellaceae bacterium]
MFGVYFHIPFCRSKCGYCDFYSVASSELQNLVLSAMEKELDLRKDYLNPLAGDNQATIYFGGGTPSLLSANEINILVEKARQVLGVGEIMEFTVEINPDDISPDHLSSLRDIGVDRLSIGIQSFFNKDLHFANRRHTAEQAIEGVRLAQKSGFQNISIDLIYGLPDLTAERWKENLQIAFELGIQHLSAYSLMVEERTPFGILQRKRKLSLPQEEGIVLQDAILNEQSKKYNFERYEISNFAKNGHYSKHNTAYWQGAKYIGIGPSAHSFNGCTRQYNVANSTKYIKGIENNQYVVEVEQLTLVEKYNEYIFTSLRTKWGITLSEVEKYGKKFKDFCLQNIDKNLKLNNLVQQERVFIPQEKMLIADAIILDFIWA